MIVYDLACDHGHRFEGWFGSADDFALQQERGLVACPVCDSASVARIPSARVSVGRRSDAPAAAGEARPAAAPAPDNKAVAAAGLPAEVVAKLREIVRSTENVGRRFPEEARKMHYDEVPARPIRGQASPEEAESLRDEGIDFSPVPPFLLNDTH
jgi:hypothetical protein